MVALLLGGLAIGGLSFARTTALEMTENVIRPDGVTCGSVWHSWVDLPHSAPRPMVDPVQFAAGNAECAALAAPRAHEALRELGVAGGLLLLPVACAVVYLVRHRPVR